MTWPGGPWGWDGGGMGETDVPRTPPGRAEVAAWWRALVAGEVSREGAHAWAAPWVEGDGGPADFADPLVVTALQYLHGFDLRRDPGRPGELWHGAAGEEGEWYRPREDIAAGLARWERNCALYDADPEGWLRGIREQARAVLRAEEAGRADEAGSGPWRTP